MTYHLGIDLGTTYTAAAVHRNGLVQIVELGNRAATAPSVLFLSEDGTFLAGDAANRRAATEPLRVTREFKRRIGDPTPLLVGGSPYSAESLTAKLLAWVVARVTEHEGEPPSEIAVTHPANWGPYKLDLLRQALRIADVSHAVLLTEPVAAAIHHATLEQIKEGMTVAVFDLGGGTFDAVILRKASDDFEILGEPEGIERLGGIDFDEAVFGFVTTALGGAFEELDPLDTTTVAAVTRLRAECVDAKEALSSDTEATIPVVLPNVQTEVRLTRLEFEDLIRPSLVDAVAALRRAVRSADLTFESIDLTLLVGGSSRIPLVGQQLGGELGLAVAVHAHPKHVVAMGASRFAASQSADAAPGTSTPDTPPAIAAPISPIAGVVDNPKAPTTAELPAQGDGAAARVFIAPPAAPKRDRVRPEPTMALVIAGLAIAAAVGLAMFFFRSNAETAEAGPEDVGDAVALEPTSDTPPVATSGADPLAQNVAQAQVPLPTSTVIPTATVVPTPTVVAFTCPSGFCAHIEGITISDGELIIDWTAHGYVPSVANFHAHFFFDIYAPNQVGTNYLQLGAASQGSWQLTDDQPFSTAGSAVSLANAPSPATSICVVPADSGHGVISPENAECVAIPPELRRG